MDTELNLFKSLDDFFNLMMQSHPYPFTQFHSLYDYVKVMKQRDPNSSAELQNLDDYFNLLKQGDPDLFAQFNSLDNFFKVMKQSNPNSFAIELAKRLATPFVYTVHYHEICVELMCKLLTEDRDLCTWRDLHLSTQSTIKTTLLDLIMKEESNYISFKSSDTVMKLAPSLISGNNSSWPELFPCLYQCVTSSTSNECTKMLAFTIIAELADEIGETMFTDVKDSLHSVLRKTLYNDTVSMDVRVAAVFAATNFILCVSNSKEDERFQYLLPGMMKTLTDTLSSTEDPIFQKKIALTCLIKLAKHEPRFLRMQLVDVVSTVFDIVEAECLGEEAGHLGVEFLMTLVEAKEKAPGMVKKLPLFIGRCFAMLLKLLVLDIKEDPTWHSTEAVYDEAWITSTFRVGEKGLRRFSCALGSKSVAQEAKEQLSAYLVVPQWEKRHAALFALANIAEGCSEVIFKNLGAVMRMVLKCLRDPHPRVRWAACRAIARSFLYFDSHVIEKYLNQVYRTLSVVLDDFHPRVQAHAMLALSIICMSNKAETLIPHLDGIVSKLFVLLQNEKQMIQLQALRLFTFTALSAKEHFRTYYDTLIPLLKGVLRNADLKADLSLRGSAIECISSVGFAVGKEKFREDANQIIEMLMPLQGLLERIDDSTTWQILRASIRICECMGKELLPYLSAVIPLLIQCAKWHVEKHEVDDKRYTQFTSIEKVMFRDKTLWEIHDGHLIGKLAHACKLLNPCAEILKEDFYPWIPQVVSVLVPLLKFHSNNLVRAYAVEVLPSMLRCAKLAVEKGIAQGASESYFTELSDNIIKALVEALHKERVGDLCKFMLKNLNNCLQICRPLLLEGWARIIVDEIKHIITDSSSRKQELREREKFEDFDDEEAGLLMDERRLEELIFINVAHILRTLIKALKAAFFPFLDELSSYLKPMLVKEQTTNLERSRAISIFTYLVEECPEAAVKYYDVCFPLILDASNDDDPHVRQNALYGLRLWAVYGGSSFKHSVREALPRINKVIMHSKARELENESAYDNAVSALGMICEFHCETIDLAEVIPVWLNCLPIKFDLLEAQDVHEQLCSMVERSQKELFGPNNEYIPKIVSVFAKVLCSKNDLATKETANRMINILRHLQHTIPISIVLSEMSYLLPQHEMELKSILSLDADNNTGSWGVYERQLCRMDP